MLVFRRKRAPPGPTQVPAPSHWQRYARRRTTRRAKARATQAGGANRRRTRRLAFAIACKERPTQDDRAVLLVPHCESAAPSRARDRGTAPDRPTQQRERWRLALLRVPRCDSVRSAAVTLAAPRSSWRAGPAGRTAMAGSAARRRPRDTPMRSQPVSCWRRLATHSRLRRRARCLSRDWAGARRPPSGRSHSGVGLSTGTPTPFASGSPG